MLFQQSRQLRGQHVVHSVQESGVKFLQLAEVALSQDALHASEFREVLLRYTVSPSDVTIDLG